MQEEKCLDGRTRRRRLCRIKQGIGREDDKKIREEVAGAESASGIFRRYVCDSDSVSFHFIS